MKNPLSKYIAQARNERTLGADGQIDGSLYFENHYSADGQQENLSAGLSQPYIINIDNTAVGAVNVANFDIFGALKYLYSAGWANGVLTLNGVKISSGLSNVTYQELLGQTAFNPFTVGKTYLMSTAGSAAQILQPFTVETGDANGNKASRAMIPALSPNQMLQTVLEYKQAYRIDNYTKLVFSNIFAGASMQIHFYPTDNINISRGLSGAQVSKSFALPQLGS